jgi:hypothetical protein
LDAVFKPSATFALNTIIKQKYIVLMANKIKPNEILKGNTKTLYIEGFVIKLKQLNALGRFVYNGAIGALGIAMGEKRRCEN